MKNVIKHVQFMQTKIHVFQTQIWFLQDEVQLKNILCDELVMVHNNPIFEDDDNDDDDDDSNK